jgi:hypothetical protein
VQQTLLYARTTSIVNVECGRYLLGEHVEAGHDVVVARDQAAAAPLDG